MKEKIDFSKCPLYKTPSCIGKITPNIGRAVSSQVTWNVNGKSYSADVFDFSKQHNCSMCPEYKSN